MLYIILLLPPATCRISGKVVTEKVALLLFHDGNLNVLSDSMHWGLAVICSYDHDASAIEVQKFMFAVCRAAPTYSLTPAFPVMANLGLGCGTPITIFEPS